MILQGPEEMCLSLEHQKPSKTSEKWVILIALQFRYTFYRPQTKRLRARKMRIWLAVIDFQNGEEQSRSGADKKRRCRAPARIWPAVIEFQNGEQQSRSGSDEKRRNRLQ